MQFELLTSSRLNLFISAHVFLFHPYKPLLYYKTTSIPTTLPLIHTIYQVNSHLENNLQTIYALTVLKKLSTPYLHIIDMSRCYLQYSPYWFVCLPIRLADDTLPSRGVRRDVQRKGKSSDLSYHWLYTSTHLLSLLYPRSLSLKNSRERQQLESNVSRETFKPQQVSL
jgi:hypothetical protein